MYVAELIILTYFSFVVFHNLFFSLISFAYSEKKFSARKLTNYSKIAVLVPAYKEDAVILSTIKDALHHNYPVDKFCVVVIADSLQDKTVEALNRTSAIVHVVNFEKSTKVKSLQTALNSLENFDIAVILDADNVMREGFLLKINEAFQNGFTSIQGRRVAKNLNTDFAVLDGISENINNQIFRKGFDALGLSVPLIGSGMSFPFEILKDHINNMNSIGGFDRELNLRLLETGQKVNYLESAVVLDEKVDKAETFANQRRRWLSSQFVYLRRYFLKGFKALFEGKIAFFEAAVVNNLLLPRVLVLGLLTIITALYLIFKNYVTFWVGLPPLLLSLYLIALIIAIPRSYFNKHLFIALFNLPRAFIIMFVNLFKLKNANKSFIHTPHTVISSESDKK